ncbi:MAG: N-acetylgalactosamine 6-sulfate sulfatase, partial [Epsilonproteobacteria bacterium]
MNNYICFIMRKIFILSLVVTMLSSMGCTTGNIAEEVSRPNFLIILVDDLGKEWISCYGADSIYTPAIDELTATGMKFHNAYSMPQCTPSRVTLLTGQYPFHHGWINHYDVPRWGHRAHFDPGQNTTFANILRNAGYKTCAAGKWQINDFRLEPEAMVKAGFDEYCMWTGGEGGNEALSSERYWDPYIHTVEGSRVYSGEFGPDIFSEFIIDFMKENREYPLCIYYPMVLTHSPFIHTPLEPYVTTTMEKHQAMTRYTDHIIHKIVTALDELEIRDNTYLIFATDNGTANRIIGRRDGTPVRGGKTYLSENGVNAPFIINIPKLTDAGSDIYSMIDFTDIFPTLLDLAGVKIPRESDIDGISFEPVLRGKPEDHQREWVLAMGSHGGRIGDDGMIKNWFEFRDRTIRNKQYKVYVDTLMNIYRLFDLATDPSEKNNLIDSKDEMCRDAIEYFQEILNDFPTIDNHPDYLPLDSSIYDIPPEWLVKSHKKDLKKDNMSPP